MTTIAIDRDGYLAWDSRLIRGTHDIEVGRMRKVRVRKGVIYAMSGEIHRFDALIEWYEAGADWSRCQGGDWDMLVITQKGVTLYDNYVRAGADIKGPYAIGSGSKYAQGALAAGASAKEAVKIASKFDTSTGGRIWCRKIEDML